MPIIKDLVISLGYFSDVSVMFGRKRHFYAKVNKKSDFYFCRISTKAFNDETAFPLKPPLIGFINSACAEEANAM